MTARTIMTLFSLLILSGGNTVFARDVVTITSDKTAVVDKVNGTAVWLKNVRIVRESSGSNLVSDRFSAKRDPISGRIIQGEAIGNVRAVYFPQQPIRLSRTSRKRVMELPSRQRSPVHK